MEAGPRRSSSYSMGSRRIAEANDGGLMKCKNRGVSHHRGHMNSPMGYGRCLVHFTRLGPSLVLLIPK